MKKSATRKFAFIILAILIGALIELSAHASPRSATFTPYDVMTPGLRVLFFGGDARGEDLNMNGDLSVSLLVKKHSEADVEKQILTFEKFGLAVDHSVLSDSAKSGYTTFRVAGLRTQLILAILNFNEGGEVVWAGLGDAKKAMKRVNTESCAEALK